MVEPLTHFVLQLACVPDQLAHYMSITNCFVCIFLVTARGTALMILVVKFLCVPTSQLYNRNNPLRSRSFWKTGVAMGIAHGAAAFLHCLLLCGECSWPVRQSLRINRQANRAEGKVAPRSSHT